MKKSFIIAAAALAMCACTKNEVNDLNEKINFAPASHAAQTKAGTDMPGDFGVYAWYTAGTKTNQVFMTNEKVSKEGVTTETYYWPKTGSIDFVGYYPYGTCWFDVTENPKTDNGYEYTSNYTSSIITGDYSGFTTPDLMYADEAKGQTKADPNVGVPMTFHHALSQLTVKMKQSILEKEGKVAGHKTKWEIKVTKVTISGIENKGSVVISSPAASPAVTYWTPASSSELYTTTWTTAKTLTATSSAYDNFSNVLVMPQALNAKSESDPYQKIYIEYTITTTRSWDASFSVSEDVTATLPFKGTSIDKWEMGKSYLYDLTFTPTDGDDPSEVEISFTPSVVDWVDGGTETISEVK